MQRGRCTVPIILDSMLTEGLSPRLRLVVLPRWGDAPPGLLSGAMPSSSNLTCTPLPELSTGCGLRKPRAFNSAGAANNGARVVVFVAPFGAKTATSFRKRRLQLLPDDSIPRQAIALRENTISTLKSLNAIRLPGDFNVEIGIGRRGHAATGEQCTLRWKPYSAFNTGSGLHPQEGSSRGLYFCLNRHA